MRGKKVLFILSLTVLVLFLLVGVFADFLAPCDPNAVDMANGLPPPPLNTGWVPTISAVIC